MVSRLELAGRQRAVRVVAALAEHLAFDDRVVRRLHDLGAHVAVARDAGLVRRVAARSSCTAPPRTAPALTFLKLAPAWPPWIGVAVGAGDVVFLVHARPPSAESCRCPAWQVRHTAVFCSAVASFVFSALTGLFLVGSFRCSDASPWQAWQALPLASLFAPCAVSIVVLCDFAWHFAQTGVTPAAVGICAKAGDEMNPAKCRQSGCGEDGLELHGTPFCCCSEAPFAVNIRSWCRLRGQRAASCARNQLPLGVFHASQNAVRLMHVNEWSKPKELSVSAANCHATKCRGGSGRGRR